LPARGAPIFATAPVGAIHESPAFFPHPSFAYANATFPEGKAIGAGLAPAASPKYKEQEHQL